MGTDQKNEKMVNVYSRETAPLAVDRKMQPPCEAACPAGIKVQDYISLIAQGRYLEAIAVIRERMPFPSVCGRLCYHPCELECNRGLLDEPVAIMYLKRFAADYEFETHPPLPPPMEITKPERVAIIGAGLSGLTAAQDLVKMGYPVTVFEASPFPGGTLRWLMFPYRLPAALLDWDVQNILALGVELKTDITVGKDLSLEDLKVQGYKAIFIATGADKSRSSSVPSAGIIAEGDLIFGTVWAVHTVGAGHQAAMSIERYLRGEPLAPPNTIALPVVRRDRADLQEKVLGGELRLRQRAEMPLWEPLETTLGFMEMESGFCEEAAVREALRCLNCGAGAQCLEEKCIACLTCVRICPYGAPMITPDGSVAIRLEQCLACGICASECPAKAIALRSYRGEEVIQRIDAALAEASRSGSAPVILGLCCSYGPYAMGEFNEFLGTKLPPNIRVVKIPCVAKIETNHLLKAFELGADGVFVAGCGQEDCPYHKSSLWIERRVEATKKILTEIGLGAERLQIYLLSEPLTPQFVEKIAEITERVKELHPIPGKGRSVAQ